MVIDDSRQMMTLRECLAIDRRAETAVASTANGSCGMTSIPEDPSSNPRMLERLSEDERHFEAYSTSFS